MSEYINRETAKRALRIWITDCVLDGDTESIDRFRDCIDLLDSLDASDVAPVVHGEWGEWEHGGGHYCTVCGKDSLCDGVEEEVLSNFCPNCGAKMDKEENNELD